MRSKQMKFLHLLFVLVFFFSSCKKDPTALNESNNPEFILNQPAIPVNLDSDSLANVVDPKLISANNTFAIQVFKMLDAEEPAENIFISPLSLSIALTMTYNGAQENTQNEMAITLAIDQMNREAVNKAYSDLVLSLQNCDPDVILNIANSMWINNHFPVKKDFIQTILSNFYADVAKLDFASDHAVTQINNWVSEQTNEKISEIITSIDYTTVLFLINALYFKANWIYQFDPDLTKEENFFLPDGSKKTVFMMTNGGRDYTYYFDRNVSIARMPYGRDKLAMYVFLPEKETDINAFINSFDPDMMQSWLNGIDSLQTNREDFVFKLPKFKLKYDKTLNEVLKNLGMQEAFTRAANFRGISDVPLWLSFVKQKTYIEVNEYGCEAAAVTIVGGMAVSVPPSFIADRPFVFIIRDDRSGSILFMGKIVDPEY